MQICPFYITQSNYSILLGIYDYRKNCQISMYSRLSRILFIFLLSLLLLIGICPSFYQKIHFSFIIDNVFKVFLFCLFTSFIELSTRKVFLSLSFKKSNINAVITLFLKALILVLADIQLRKNLVTKFSRYLSSFLLCKMATALFSISLLKPLLKLDTYFSLLFVAICRSEVP